MTSSLFNVRGALVRLRNEGEAAFNSAQGYDIEYFDILAKHESLAQLLPQR
jgi:hypothetical protein